MPKYREWYERAQKEAPLGREVSTFMGRKRFLYGSDKDSVKQWLNTPIQGGAAHIINQPMIRLQDRIEAESLPMKLICQIHDELIFEILQPHVQKCKKIIRDEMSKPLDYKGRTVSFPIDIKTGTRWGEMEE
jgi:DNA polymerase-1